MNEVLKQRLIGALVIIAIAVVFWPFIFVEPGGQPLDRRSQVPSMPSLKEMQIEEPSPIPDLDPPASTEDLLLHDAPPGAIDALESDSDANAEPASDTQDQTPSLAPDKTTEVVPTPPVSRLDENGIPIAWTLQVVVVSKQEKADEIRRALIDSGYKAYTRLHRQGNTTLYKVYVGPNFDQQVIVDIKAVVDKAFKVNSIVARYVP